MIRGNRLAAESNMAFRADEFRIFPATIDFRIQRAAFIEGRCDVTSIGAAARTHRHSHGHGIDGVESRTRGIVTVQAT